MPCKDCINCHKIILAWEYIKKIPWNQEKCHFRQNKMENCNFTSYALGKKQV